MKKYLFIMILATWCIACHKDSEELEMPEVPAVLLLSEHDFELPKEGGAFSVEVNASGGYAVEIAPICHSWLVEEDAPTGADVEKTHRFAVAANDAFRMREGYVVFKNGGMRDTVHIRQQASGILLLSEKQFEVSEEGGTFSVEVNATAECTLEVPAAFRAWLSEVPESRAVFSKACRFTVAPNNTYREREGFLVVGNGTLSDTLRIRQAATTLWLLSTHNVTLPDEEGNFSVEVKYDADFTVTIPETFASWLTETIESTPHFRRFKVTKNGEYRDRTGYVVFGNDGFTDTVFVNQGPKGGLRWGEDFTEHIMEGIDLEMVYVEGGTFMMGAPDEETDNGWWAKPAHPVTLSDYYIAKYIIRKEVWTSIMEISPDSPNNSQSNTPMGDVYDKYWFVWFSRHIPQGVSWNEAQLFIEKLNRQTGKTYALPIEAQWEYAARGGKKSKGYKYSGSDNLEEVVLQWFQMIGEKIPNELGIYDMTGKSEWCQDYYSQYFYEFSPSENPTGPLYNTTQGHVVRDGSPVWNRSSSTEESNSICLRLVLLP